MDINLNEIYYIAQELKYLNALICEKPFIYIFQSLCDMLYFGTDVFAGKFNSALDWKLMP